MGIYDRDYVRPPTRGGRSTRSGGGGGRVGPGGLAGVRFWSFNTWLILINILVFVIDMLLGARGVGIETGMGVFIREGVRLSQIDYLIDRGTTYQSTRAGLPALAHPIINKATGEAVGEWRFLPMTPLKSWGHFSTGRLFYQLEIWRLVTFQFLHADITHIFMNLFALWMFGPLVEQSIGSRQRYAAYYLTCGIFGAVAYLLLNALGVVVTDAYTTLVGASAGCFGVLMAAAYFAGDEIMELFGIIPIKIRTGAYGFVALALFNILRQGSNAGGDAAHVGGAIAGYFFIRRMHLLRDFFDIFGSSSPADRAARRAARRSAPKPTARSAGPAAALLGPEPGADARLDAILDKINRNGRESLTDEERDYLSEATRARGGA